MPSEAESYAARESVWQTYVRQGHAVQGATFAGLTSLVFGPRIRELGQLSNESLSGQEVNVRPTEWQNTQRAIHAHGALTRIRLEVKGTSQVRHRYGILRISLASSAGTPGVSLKMMSPDADIITLPPNIFGPGPKPPLATVGDGLVDPFGVQSFSSSLTPLPTSGILGHMAADAIHLATKRVTENPFHLDPTPILKAINPLLVVDAGHAITFIPRLEAQQAFERAAQQETEEDKHNPMDLRVAAALTRMPKTPLFNVFQSDLRGGNLLIGTLVSEGTFMAGLDSIPFFAHPFVQSSNV